MPTLAKFCAGLGLAAGIFFAGYMAHRQPVSLAPSAPVKQVLYYTCPMHPQYKSGQAGTAPCCGMLLVPVYAGGTGSTLDTAVPEPSGTVRIKAMKQQLMGVRTDVVRRAPASPVLRSPGRIAVDEGRLYRLTAATDGWIRELGANPAGTFVKQNQLLASYYARDLLSSAQTFVFAIQTNAQAENGNAIIGPQRPPTALSLQVALDSLRGLGMSERQIDEIRKTRVAPPLINIYAPITGFVIARSLSPQQRFDKGAEMYRIADISHLWVMTDIFEKDREFARPGNRATVRYREHEFHARLSDVLPQFDPQTRTLRTRFELDNPGYLLYPDMFVDVELRTDMPAAITVPADAVIDTGLRKTVFVESGDGVFEPRLVQTGCRLGDRVEITRGLEPGERFVTSGNFLIDSESRMKLATLVASSTAENVTALKDPVCGMDVDPNAPRAIRMQHGAKIHYFCSDKCKKDFEANPGKYVSQSMSAQDGTGAKRGPV
jgi:membrane fusion protein, copper/silver efflux system